MLCHEGAQLLTQSLPAVAHRFGGASGRMRFDLTCFLGRMGLAQHGQHRLETVGHALQGDDVDAVFLDVFFERHGKPLCGGPGPGGKAPGGGTGGTGGAGGGKAPEAPRSEPSAPEAAAPAKKKPFWKLF